MNFLFYSIAIILFAFVVIKGALALWYMAILLVLVFVVIGYTKLTTKKVPSSSNTSFVETSIVKFRQVQNIVNNADNPTKLTEAEKVQADKLQEQLKSLLS